MIERTGPARECIDFNRRNLVSMNLRLPLRILSVVFATLLFALTAAPLLHADTVVLKNGDRLTGTAIKLDGGKLTFKTAYADAILIAWEQVTSLTTNQPLVLPEAKKNLTVTAIERSDAGLTVTTPTGPATLPAAAVTVLRTPADQKEYEASLHPNWAHAWAGTANLSLALARGNSDTATFGAGFAAARATHRQNLTLRKYPL
jgi:hypothetical protein